MSSTFNDPIAVNNTLAVAAMGAKTASFTGTDLSNSATSSTNSIDKIGVRIAATGTWSGTGAKNYALKIEPATGGTNNWNFWSGSTSSFSSYALDYADFSQNVFAIKNGADGVAPALFVSESNNGSAITSLNALGIGTSGASDIIGLWGEARCDGATLNSMAAVQAQCTGGSGSVGDSVNFWANGNGNEGVTTRVYTG